MTNINQISKELLEFRENYLELVTDQTFLTVDSLINKLYDTTKTNNLWWYPPKLSIGNADGTVLLEWENKDKVLFIYIIKDNINYDALWGITNEDEELYREESGDINIENDLTEFLEWITE